MAMPITTAPHCAPGYKSRTRTKIPITETILTNSPIKNALTCEASRLCTTRLSRQANTAVGSITDKPPHKALFAPVAPHNSVPVNTPSSAAIP